MADATTLEIDAARRIFADAIAKCTFAPKFPIEIKVRPSEATAIHCQWPLAEKGPYSRGITVHITAGAMSRFRQANARARDEMLERFMRVFQIRLIQGGYRDKDPPTPPFIVHIDVYSLEPLSLGRRVGSHFSTTDAVTWGFDPHIKQDLL